MRHPWLTMTDCPDLIVKRGKSAGLGADLVCSDSANGVNDPCIVAKAVDFFPGAVNPEFVIGLDQVCAPKVEGSQGSLVWSTDCPSQKNV